MFGYDVGYRDGLNHALDLVAKFTKKARKKHSAKKILKVICNRSDLEDAIFDFDPGYFNNYNEDIGPIK
ncbi:hypothetical protein SAMN05216349_1502 [Oribacterium sp. KHPX15]|uniref:hypothetical protein n=1 Tax=Oribacterium sp. KHPX15 TaxID=1855342 RepID=UPI00089973C2|nr:hypothetical protein [Oribacterium sp. KHPX15]SEA90592.1 hypothetical protein SAMN05216349_1502 [Oribacterium sp. KHPX15]